MSSMSNETKSMKTNYKLYASFKISLFINLIRVIFPPALLKLKSTVIIKKPTKTQMKQLHFHSI